MRQEEIERLKYRRQYILVPAQIECPFLHNVHEIGNSYLLYSHIDLKVTRYAQQDIILVLLGDIFDYRFPRMGNSEILADLIDGDFKRFLKKTDQYTGRFVLIYKNGNNLYILHDATASRKVFYTLHNTSLWLSSRSHLLAKILNLKITTNASRLAYYHSEDFKRLSNANIGNTTPYDEVFQLIPNHYLDLAWQKTIRYWPYQKLEKNSMQDIEIICAEIIKGYMESVASRYEFMLPVTAGKDSRILLAAARNILDRGLYYMNKMRLIETDPDIKVPTAMFSDLGLRFQIIETPDSVDPDFSKVYYENNHYVNEVFLPIIYNYYLNFGDRINLPGNFASAGLELYRCFISKVTAEKLASYNRVRKYAFAAEYYAGWLKESLPFCKENGINILDLFYWEERQGNWGTQIQMEKDIAQEDINVFNSRILISLFLSLDPKEIVPPEFVFQKRIIQKLWPELLFYPINPIFKYKLELWLKQFGLLKFINKLRCIRYQFPQIRHPI